MERVVEMNRTNRSAEVEPSDLNTGRTLARLDRRLMFATLRFKETSEGRRGNDAVFLEEFVAQRVIIDYDP